VGSSAGDGGREASAGSHDVLGAWGWSWRLEVEAARGEKNREDEGGVRDGVGVRLGSLRGERQGRPCGTGEGGARPRGGAAT
jgi:hypothetical protein